MTIAERNNKLKHFITCLKCEVSGKPCDVNCPTQYEAGNMGEIIENLETISKALEQEPKYCDRNICVSNEYNGIGCDECEVTKSQEPKTGHWIKSNIPNEKYVCSECGGCCWYYDYQADVAKSRFCPNCGARMVEQESEVV